MGDGHGAVLALHHVEPWWGQALALEAGQVALQKLLLPLPLLPFPFQLPLAALLPTCAFAAQFLGRQQVTRQGWGAQVAVVRGRPPGPVPAAGL